MKKIMILVTAAILFALLFSGCGNKIDREDKTITIDEMSIDFTNIEITEDTSGNGITLDVEQSAELYDKIKNIQFVQEESSKGITNWGYAMNFLRGTTVEEKFSVVDENRIDYKGNRYHAKTSAFNKDDFDTFFNKTFTAKVIESGASLLVAPDIESSEFKTSDKMSVSLMEATIINIDGQNILKEQLEVGDIIIVTYNGVILESYPAQISASKIEVIELKNKDK